MKNIYILLTTISLTIFAACSQQKAADELLPTTQETPDLLETKKTKIAGNLMADAGLADFTIDNEGNSLNEGDDLLITNKSVNAVSYHWDFGNGDTSTEAQPNYKYEMHGYRTVTLTITDAHGKTHQTSHEILVLCVFGGIDHNQ